MHVARDVISWQYLYVLGNYSIATPTLFAGSANTIRFITLTEQFTQAAIGTACQEHRTGMDFSHREFVAGWFGGELITYVHGHT